MKDNDINLFETPLNPEETRLRILLIKMASREQFMNYQDCSKYARLFFDLENPFDRRHFSGILDNVSCFEVAYGRPMLGVLAVHPKTERPGKGFFRLASRIGLLNENASPAAKLRFAREQEKEAIQFWRSKAFF